MGCNSSSVVNGNNVPTSFQQDLAKSSLKLDDTHCFSFSSIIASLKSTPSVTENGVEYGLLHTGGFVRVATDVCRVYYLAQNTTEHTTPDWKFHVSVCFDDLPLAWDIIVKLFIESGCRSGMKMCFCDISNYFGHWSPGQFGREITIYIYKHKKQYQSLIVDDPKLKLTRKLEHPPKFWRKLVSRIEKALAQSDIRTNGLADGDYPINRYVSIRNEAYVHVGRDLVYPPNAHGFNAAGHKCPIKLPALQSQPLPPLTQPILSLPMSASQQHVTDTDTITVVDEQLDVSCVVAAASNEPNLLTATDNGTDKAIMHTPEKTFNVDNIGNEKEDVVGHTEEGTDVAEVDIIVE